MRIVLDAATVAIAIIMGLPWWFVLGLVIITAISILKDYRDDESHEE